MDDPAGELDRISALPDDLLHVILGCLGYAPAVMNTAVLSRRWRHVWTGAKSLTFKDSDMCLQMNKSQFVGFVDWVLAQRGDADMESLKIHFIQMGCCDSPEKVNEWLRYAARHVVKSVDIDLFLGQRTGKQDEQQVVEIPSHGRAASISLFLPNYRLRVPDATTAARYEALTKLDLFSLSFDEDGGGSLSDFVASCCPRLRRLHIVCPEGLRRLVLRSKVLEDFRICSAFDLQTLDVATPSLRVINLYQCFTDRTTIDGNGNEYVKGTNKLARIVAPKLEEIVNMDEIFCIKPTDLQIHDLASVRRLSVLHLYMHGKYHGDNGNLGFWLLERCPSVEHVDVWLLHLPREKLAMGEQLVDLTSEGKAPLVKIRSMTVRPFGFQLRHRHDFVPSMSALLVRCPHLTSLSVDYRHSCIRLATRSCFCDEVTDKWEIRGKVALEFLEEVKMTGFGGTEGEMQLVRLLFESSSSIKRMDLVHASAAKNEEAGERPDAKDMDTIYHELLKIVPGADDLGRWRLTGKTITWTRDTTS